MAWEQARADLVARWHSLGWYGRDRLDQVMSARAALHPEARFEYWGGEPVILTHGALCQRGEAAAKGLYALGLRSGDAILAQVPNCPEGAVLFYAAMRLGLVVVPVIHVYGRAELDFIARDSNAVAAVMPSGYRNIDWKERAETLSAVPTMREIVGIGDVDLGGRRWADVEQGAAVDLPEPPTDADARCLVVYTSGTTSFPKGAQHSHNSLLSEIQSTSQAFDRPPDAPYLQAQPAGHMAGLLGLLRAIHDGTSRTIMLDSWDANLAARAVAETGVARTTGPPYFLTTMLEVAEAQGMDLSSLSDYMTGGERVPVSLVERGDAAGVGVYRCYGSTEHPTVTTSLPTDPLIMRAHTDGRTLPGAEVSVVDDEDRPVGPGFHGQVITIGPDQFIQYTNPELNAACFTDAGWFRTGDVGRLDETGVLTITDRIKDIVIRGGENISSREVEEILLRHPSVADVAVIALPDRRFGERACAVVSLRPGRALDLSEVRRHFTQAGVAKQKTPEWVEIVEEFPRTPVGKIKKNVLRDQIKPPAEWSGNAS